MAKKITLEFTERQLECFISLIETIEAMQGCSDGDGSGSEFDEETTKEIKNIDRMFKMNSYTRKFS